jgi:hypothetical protein
MTQNLKGNFDITFWGNVILSVSKSVLTPEKGTTAIVYSLHLTPLFAIGFTRIVKSK